MKIIEDPEGYHIRTEWIRYDAERKDWIIRAMSGRYRYNRDEGRQECLSCEKIFAAKYEMCESDESSHLRSERDSCECSTDAQLTA